MKMIQDGAILTLPEDMVEAFDGGNQNKQSPNQVALDAAMDQIAKPVYNFQTVQISGFQKILLYGAAIGVAYIIYKKYFKR